jgi:hypothetical protein
MTNKSVESLMRINGSRQLVSPNKKQMEKPTNLSTMNTFKGQFANMSGVNVGEFNKLSNAQTKLLKTNTTREKNELLEKIKKNNNILKHLMAVSTDIDYDDLKRRYLKIAPIESCKYGQCIKIYTEHGDLEGVININDEAYLFKLKKYANDNYNYFNISNDEITKVKNDPKMREIKIFIAEEVGVETAKLHSQDIAKWLAHDKLLEMIDNIYGYYRKYFDKYSDSDLTMHKFTGGRRKHSTKRHRVTKRRVMKRRTTRKH